MSGKKHPEQHKVPGLCSISESSVLHTCKRPWCQFVRVEKVFWACWNDETLSWMVQLVFILLFFSKLLFIPEQASQVLTTTPPTGHRGWWHSCERENLAEVPLRGSWRTNLTLMIRQRFEPQLWVSPSRFAVLEESFQTGLKLKNKCKIWNLCGSKWSHTFWFFRTNIS